MLFLENFPLFYGNSFLQLYNKDPSQKPLAKRNRAIQRCEFKPIPTPTRVPDLHERIYHLYGDVVLMEKNGVLVAEPSLINNFKTFKDVQVTKHQNEKVITVFPQKKREFNPHRWMDLVRRMNEIGSEESLEWGQIVHDFCRQAQKAIDLCVTGQKLMKDEEKKALEGITAWSNEKKAKIIANHPCIMMKTCLNRSGFGLTEISVNEKLLIEAGYSVDTYSSLVLEEGLRQFMPYNDRLACGAIKLLLRDCFDFTNDLLKPLDLDNFLLMKSGYVKKVKTQVHFLPSYHDESFEIIRVISIVDKGVPYLEGITPSPAIVTPDFWESMVQKEHDLKYFLGNFYDKTAPMRYTNINKICRIRELKKPAIKAGSKRNHYKQQNAKLKAIEDNHKEDEELD